MGVKLVTKTELKAAALTDPEAESGLSPRGTTLDPERTWAHVECSDCSTAAVIEIPEAYEVDVVNTAPEDLGMPWACGNCGAVNLVEHPNMVMATPVFPKDAGRVAARHALKPGDKVTRDALVQEVSVSDAGTATDRSTR